mgnify:FL=1
MASSKDYLQFVLEQLSELQEITYRAMMGEFIIYYRGKIVGGIYDDRLLVKPTKSAISYMPTVTYEIPYENAKEMLLVEEVDNKDFLTGLFDVMYDELPTPKPKKKKASADVKKTISRNVKIALNTLQQAIGMIEKTGTSLQQETEDLEDEYVITIRIHK